MLRFSLRHEIGNSNECYQHWQQMLERRNPSVGCKCKSPARSNPTRKIEGLSEEIVITCNGMVEDREQSNSQGNARSNVKAVNQHFSPCSRVVQPQIIDTYYRQESDPELITYNKQC